MEIPSNCMRRYGIIAVSKLWGHPKEFQPHAKLIYTGIDLRHLGVMDSLSCVPTRTEIAIQSDA